MSRKPYDLMNLRALRCFETMAKHGSLTRASIELGISDAAVSQRIKSLEKYLGVKLYESRGGRVRLTEAGQRTKEMATRWFDELAEFEEAIGDEASGGTLVLSAQAPLLRYQLPNIVDSYARAHRHIRLRLLSRRPSETIELVRRNEVDVGIVHELPMPAAIQFHPWRVFKANILIPRGHPLARGGVPTLQDVLNEETLLRYPQVMGELDEREPNRVKEVLERLGLPYNVALEVGNIETVKHYVARGHGIAVVSSLCLSPEDESAFHMIEIPEELEGETTYGVILREGKHISPSLRGLLTLLEVPNISPPG